LARHLQELSVGPEKLVGIYMERSPDVIAGILAILKAGGAYVPIDPGYPSERVRFMLEDSQVSVLLTQEHLCQTIRTDETEVLCLDADWPLIAQQEKGNPEHTASLENLAYVIYTSGSTGQPRGVCITHANLYPYVQAMQELLEINARDRHLHTVSFAFAASVRQFLMPLCMGGAVVVAPTEQVRDPVTLFETIKEHDVTIMGVNPSYWQSCVNVLASMSPERREFLLDNRLRLVVSASEPLWSDLPRTWRSDFGHGARLVNMLGQTEATGILTSYPIPAIEDEQRHILPVGRPLTNVRVYMLDRHMQPVPIGVPGEIHVGGRLLARGYLGNAALTARKLVPNPFDDTARTRLYRTGDRGRCRADGTIEFLGRADHQVKIRGFRVELAEVEARLGEHPQVRECVVVAREAHSGSSSPSPPATVPGKEGRLVAYVVPRQRPEPSTSDLRRFLQEYLPEYMIPSAFVTMDALPLTPNGKVDRGALPEPDSTRPALEQPFDAPRTPLEEVLASMWAQVLEVENIGIHDSFFELGGHSLLATQFASELQDIFPTEVPLLGMFFEEPTVAGLAAAISSSHPDPAKVDKVVQALQLIGQLSGEEVEAMLTEQVDDIELSERV
jgi:aspartate racemase